MKWLDFEVKRSLKSQNSRK